MLLRVTVCLKHQISFHVICRQNHKWEKWKCVFSESHEFERQKEHSCPYLPKRNKTVKNEKWHSSTHGERTIMWHVKSLLKRTGWISLYSREQQKWNAWQICNERVLLHCFLLFFFLISVAERMSYREMCIFVYYKPSLTEYSLCWKSA